MSTVITWAAWAGLTVTWNAVNTVNSRAKNSMSLAYNLVTTLVAAGMYAGSLLLLGAELLRANGRAGPVSAALAIYAGASAAGSVLGQVVALRYEARHPVGHGPENAR